MSEHLPRLICYCGLPRSGKSTHAREFSKEHNAPIVNPDSIRLALHGQRFVGLAEGFVWAIAQVMVRALFITGYKIVILDATNTTRKRRDEWKSKSWLTLFHYMDTPKEVCLARAAETNDTEIAAVIEDMSNKFEMLDADETWFRIKN